MSSNNSYWNFVRDALRIRLGLRPSNPFVVGVTINTACNLRCSYCFIGRESEHFPDGFTKPGLAPEDLKAVLANVRKDTGMLILTGGEPFLYRGFEEILRYAKRELRFMNISIATNGMFLRKNSSCLRHIDRLGISYDLAREREYPKEMRIMLDSLVELKREGVLPPVHFTMTLAPGDDPDSLDAFANYCLANGFRAWIQPVRDHGNFRDWKWFEGIVEALVRRHGKGFLLNDPAIVRTFGRTIPECVPELRLHINEEGNLLYPCNRMENLYSALSVRDATPMTRWNEAVKAHGLYPRRECEGCGFTCYFETAGLYRRPHSFIGKALGFLLPDFRRRR